MIPCIKLIAIERHKYPEFVVSLLSNIYTITNCGLRKSVDLFEYLNKALSWGFRDIPCFNSVLIWIEKSGYSIYNETQEKTCETGYASILDESIMLGSERMILNLGIKSEKTTDTALDYNDIDVIGIHVDSGWNASKIEDCLKKDEKKMGRKPNYIISDNDKKLQNAILGHQCVHIRDIGHTLAMFLQRVYSKEEDFSKFFKQIGKIKNTEAMSDCSYLLPPRQRSIARFMNLSGTISWGYKIIESFERFTEKEKRVYNFVIENRELILELYQVFECVNNILSHIKKHGLSYDGIGYSINLINKLSACKNKRIAKFSALSMEYLLEESAKLPDSETRFNASSDMIESVFGYYKFRKSRNALNGVTAYVLILPLITKMRTAGRGIDTNFKANLEAVYMRNLQQFRISTLTENQMVNRRKKLIA